MFAPRNTKQNNPSPPALQTAAAAAATAALTSGILSYALHIYDQENGVVTGKQLQKQLEEQQTKMEETMDSKNAQINVLDVIAADAISTFNTGATNEFGGIWECGKTLQQWESLLQALEIAMQNKNTDQLLDACNNIQTLHETGDVTRTFKQRKEARTYWTSALNVFRTFNDKRDISQTVRDLSKQNASHTSQNVEINHKRNARYVQAVVRAAVIRTFLNAGDDLFWKIFYFADEIARDTNIQPKTPQENTHQTVDTQTIRLHTVSFMQQRLNALHKTYRWLETAPRVYTNDPNQPGIPDTVEE
eukprot:3939962-Rhodomonas_salina.1